MKSKYTRYAWSVALPVALHAFTASIVMGALANSGGGSGTNARQLALNDSGVKVDFAAVPQIIGRQQSTAVSPLTNGLVVYLSLDGNLRAQAGTLVNGSAYVGTPRYCSGVIGAAASFTNTSANSQPNDWAFSLGNLERFYSNSFTVSFWERNPGGSDGALMGNKNWASGANVGWVISTMDAKNVNWNVAGGTRRDLGLHPPFSDGGWHLVTVSFDRASNQVLAYTDGALAVSRDLNPNSAASLNAGFSTLVGSSGNGLYSATGDLDDLGVWNRVLTPAEVKAIYHCGLIGKPLIAAVPGDVPEITVQPVSLEITPGATASFAVAADSDGPVQYQWRFNGTNIAGATNATLTLPAIGTEGEGLYSVIVYNACGGVVSAGAGLSLYELQVTGQWDFASGDLRATVGEDLEYTGDTEFLTTFQTLDLNGTLTPVMGFGSNSAHQGFLMRHGAKPNGGGHFVNQYTLIMDVMYPVRSNDQWRALFQSDPFNHDGNDADLYVGNAGARPDPNGLGIEGRFDGRMAPDTWYRAAFAVDLAAPEGCHLVKYLNGVEVGRQSLSGGIDGRYALGPAALLFTSGIVSGGFTQPGFVSSIQFVNGWMAPQSIAALGGPSAKKLPPGNGAIRLSDIGRQGGAVALCWTGPAGLYQVEASATLANPVWKAVGPLATNRSFVLSAPGATGFYRVTHYKPDIMVGQLPHGEQSVPTKQILRAAGRQIQFAGRPVDLALSPDGNTVYIKNINALLVVDAKSWSLLQTLNCPGGGASMHGIAVSRNGSRVYVTGSGNELYEWQVAADGLVSYLRTITLPNGSDPCGVAISSDGGKMCVCLGTRNSLAVVDVAAGSIIREIKVGIAPWDVVLSPDNTKAYVSDWGGRYPVSGEAVANSAGTPVVIDSRGVAASGALSIVDLAAGVEAAQVPTGLHPSDIELSPDGATLFVANANSDTVTVIDTATHVVRETILVRPDPAFPYGSASDGLAVSKDGRRLFVASAGNNAVAVVELPNAQHTNSGVLGLLPTDWYPGAVVADSNNLYVVNVKGLGTRLGQPNQTRWQSGSHLGTAGKIPIPDGEALSKFTAQAHEFGRIQAIKTAGLPARPAQAALPVPLRRGEPSVFQHVVYILKENKTYDQVMGDLPQGNGDASLCIYPRIVTPNHHALAEQYVLLDNFYCNGVNSADGHSWSTEANVADHLEKSVGGYARSYTFGDDPLTYSSSGFIWNNVLEHGLTFRNYGEMDYASPAPSASWLQIYRDFTNGTRSIKYAQNIGIAQLRAFSSTNVPGWNLGIPDIVRADGFIRELNAAQSAGVWETFHFLYLPNDHTGGPPSPRAQVADNDLALGRAVEAITKSIFGSNTVIFVIEDDPQSGYDHVDGHRSLCLVVSPYTKRGKVVSTFYNQPGVLHTMERIMGLPPMNQQDAMAPIMFECFTNTPDFAPYTALSNNIDLAEGVSGAAALTPTQRYWAEKTRTLDLSAPDRIDEDTFNRYIWHSIKGDQPYPVAFVGSHGKGLKALGLQLAPDQEEQEEN